MKKIIKSTNKYLGEILVTIGSGIFVYNILNFSYRVVGARTEVRGGLNLDLDLGFGSGGELISGTSVGYYYEQNHILMITTSIILIVIGIFIIKNRNN